jgi:hypothetical protein
MEASPIMDSTLSGPRVAMAWRGDPDAAPALSERLEPIAQALQALGARVVPIVWSEARAADFLARLTACDGALVWVDPLTQGQDRLQLDALLRAAADRGVWVSAHPDVILKMGVKEVLVRTRGLGWGCDARRYETEEDFRNGLAETLAADRVRVIKQSRGNGGQGVWKVELCGPSDCIGPLTEIEVSEARGDTVERLWFDAFAERCEAYLSGTGYVIDQAFQPRVGEGLIRCYMSGAEVVGFSEQFPRSRGAANSSTPVFGMARDKTMHDQDAPAFGRLRRLMEQDWTPGLQRLLHITSEDLPALWDADFLYGSKGPDGEDSYVLCEINCSCVTPYPPSAAAPVARRAMSAIAASASEVSR